MIGHRALEKKQITQGNNRKVQNPGGSLFKTAKMHKALIIKHYRSFFFYIKPAFYRELGVSGFSWLVSFLLSV